MKLNYTEVALSEFISKIMDIIEKDNPEIFKYKNIYLRGAFERYFYFDAISDTSRISPLLTKYKKVKKKNKDFDLNEYGDLSNGFFYRIINVYFLPWLRVFSDILNNFRLKNLDISTQNSYIGFFVINSRLVDFFKIIYEQLPSGQATFYSSNPIHIGDTVKKIGASLIYSHITLKDIGKLKISKLDPLFPIYFRFCFFYTQIHKALSESNPNILLFSEGTSHYDDLASRAAEVLRIPSVRVQSGRAGILHCGYRNMHFDAMLCWSNDFVERYQSVSPKPAYHVIGSPLLDEVHQLNDRRVSSSKPGKVIIFTQPASKHISDQDYLLLIELAEGLLESDESIELIVRKHPIDKHFGFDELQEKYLDRISLMNSPTFSLSETLIHSCCAVGFFSTTLSESAACGVVPIILQTNEQQSVYPFPEKHGAAIVVYSAEEAILKILEYKNQPEHFWQIKTQMMKFSQRFFGPNDGNSKKRMFALIKQYTRKFKDAE